MADTEASAAAAMKLALKNADTSAQDRLGVAKVALDAAQAAYASSVAAEQLRLTHTERKLRDVKESLADAHRVAIQVGSEWDIPAVRALATDAAPCLVFMGEKGPWFYVEDAYGDALATAESAWNRCSHGTSVTRFLRSDNDDANKKLMRAAWKEIPTPDRPECNEDDCYHHNHFPQREVDCYHKFRPTGDIMCDVCYSNGDPDEKEYVEDFVEDFWDTSPVCHAEYKPDDAFATTEELGAYYFALQA